MAEKRYTNIWVKETPFWDFSSPVVIEKHAMVADAIRDSLCAQLKLENICGQTINAVHVSIACKRADNTPTDGIDEYIYVGLNATADATFGSDKLLPLPDKTTVEYDVAISKVVFSDQTIWQPIEYYAAKPLLNPRPLSSLGDMEAQYRRDILLDRQICLPDVFEIGWRCGCGQINMDKTKPCIACSVNLQDMLQAINPDILKANLVAYQVEQTNLRQIEAVNAEQARLENEQKSKEKLRRIRKAKRIVVILAIVAVISCSILIYWFYPVRGGLSDKIYYSDNTRGIVLYPDGSYSYNSGSGKYETTGVYTWTRSSKITLYHGWKFVWGGTVVYATTYEIHDENGNKVLSAEIKTVEYLNSEAEPIIRNLGLENYID